MVRAGHADGPSWLQLAEINAKPSPQLRILGLHRFNARNIHFELVSVSSLSLLVFSNLRQFLTG